MDNLNNKEKQYYSKYSKEIGDSVKKINNTFNSRIKSKVLKDRGDIFRIVGTKNEELKSPTANLSNERDGHTNNSQINRDKYKNNDMRYANGNAKFNKVANNRDESRANIDYVKSNVKNVNINLAELKKDGDINKRASYLNKQYENTFRNTLNLKTEANRDTKVPVTTEPKHTTESDTRKNYTNQKTPLIKTVQNDTKRTFKTVTFTEKGQKKKLNIKIPNITKERKTKIPKLITTKTNIKDTRANDNKTFIKVNKVKRKREILSPVYKRGGSPLTEVAKWAPNSVNELTKPYYEAWINTSLATSNIMKREKQLIIKEFKKTLDKRSFSPELMYENFADERFTGRIRINRK